MIALYISIIMLPLVLLVYKYTANLDIDYMFIGDEIAINELRELLLITYELNINDDSLNFIYQGKEFELSLVNNKLLLQPGTMIYLYGIDDLNFYEKNNSIYISYLRKGKRYEKNIMSKTSIYLDDLYSCLDECRECDLVDEFVSNAQ